MVASTVRRLGVNFGRVEFVFFAAVKGTSMDPLFAMNRMLHSVLVDENFSIAIRHNVDIFVNCKTRLKAHILLNYGW